MPDDATLTALRWHIGDAFQERAAGLVHTYRLVAMKPHTTRAGDQSIILYWAGSCAVCGGRLMALSGKQPRYLARTCMEHRGTWMPPKRGRAHG